MRQIAHMPAYARINEKKAARKIPDSLSVGALSSRPPLVDHCSTTPFGVRVIGGPRQFKYNQSFHPGKGQERLGTVFSYGFLGQTRFLIPLVKPAVTFAYYFPDTIIAKVKL